MANYVATVVWTRAPDAPFKDNKYSRAHEWRFDGGAVVKGSSAPSSVKVPLSDPTAVDPEEALVAALSSCHMLFFLSFAAMAGFVVDRYEDDAVGEMGKNANGKTALVKITLRPKVDWVGAPPSAQQLDELHHKSHDHCYIANTVNAHVDVQSR